MRLSVALPAALVAVLLSGATQSVHAAVPSLVEAARQGDVQAVRAALLVKADVNASAADGTTALQWAAQRGDAEVVKLLLAKGAKVDLANRYGVTALRASCVQGNTAVVQALLAAGANANAVRAESGDTPLMMASRSGHVEIVKALLAKGAQVNLIEPLRKQSALMWAAAEGHGPVVQTLVEAGADVKALSSTKMTPLMFAIRSGSIPSVDALLAKGLDVNGTASDGTHMLHLAIINARFELAKHLLDRGADANVDDIHGKPLHTLAFMRRAENRALSTVLPRQLPQSGVDAFALADALLAKGADINARYATVPGPGVTPMPPRHIALGSYRMALAGATPFFISTMTADVPFMRYLAKKGADTSIGSLTGVSPLLAASGIGYWEGETPGTNAEAFEAVKVAAELGNDPKALVGGGPKTDASWEGSSAMHGAANRGAVEIVSWLAEKGVPLDSRSKRGITPYHHAAGLDGFLFHASPETVQLLDKLAAARGEKIDKTEPAPLRTIR